jgi:hypothetical protein
MTMNDLSYLNTEYARNKMIEEYNTPYTCENCGRTYCGIFSETHSGHCSPVEKNYWIPKDDRGGENDKGNRNS